MKLLNKGSPGSRSGLPWGSTTQLPVGNREKGDDDPGNQMTHLDFRDCRAQHGEEIDEDNYCQRNVDYIHKLALKDLPYVRPGRATCSGYMYFSTPGCFRQLVAGVVLRYLATGTLRTNLASGVFARSIRD